MDPDFPRLVTLLVTERFVLPDFSLEKTYYCPLSHRAWGMLRSFVVDPFVNFLLRLVFVNFLDGGVAFSSRLLLYGLFVTTQVYPVRAENITFVSGDTILMLTAGALPAV